MFKTFIVTSLLAASCFAVTPFSLPQMNENGKLFNSNDYPNSIFVVETYFLDCPYCNDNAPEVNDVASQFSNDPRVHVLDVGRDKNDSQYATWIQRHHPNHPVLKDAQKTLISQLGTTGYPSTYILDCNLKVTHKTEGSWSSTDKKGVINAIKALQNRTDGDCQY